MAAPKGKRKRVRKLTGYAYIRKHGLPAKWRADFIYKFRFGAWKSFHEQGDRDGLDDPCINIVRGNSSPCHGLYAYQAAYVLFHNAAPKEGDVISHRCGKAKGISARTNCCTVSHMKTGKDQKENVDCQDCHQEIRTKGYREEGSKVKGSAPFVGVRTFPDCPHKKIDGTGYCLISYGENKVDKDGVEKFVLIGWLSPDCLEISPIIYG